MATRVVVVTGAAGALGRVVAERVAADGAAVVAVDVADATSLPACASLSLGRLDLSDGAAAERAFASAGERFGRVDGLVNVAGGFAWEKVADGKTDTWDRLYNLNVRTAQCMSGGDSLAERQCRH